MNKLSKLNENDIIKLSEEEYDILSIYLSRINDSDAPKQNHAVHISSKELEKIFGKPPTKENLQQCLQHLMSTVVEANDRLVTIFGRTRVYRSCTGWCIDLTCTDTAYRYFFYPEIILRSAEADVWATYHRDQPDYADCGSCAQRSLL